MPPQPPKHATKDLLLQLSQNQALRPWLSRLGLPTPLILERGGGEGEGNSSTSSSFSMPPLKNRPVAIYSYPSTTPSASISTLLSQQLGAQLTATTTTTESQGENSKSFVVDATWCKTPADVTSLAIQVLQPLAAKAPLHSRIVLLSSLAPASVMSNALASGLSSLVRSLAKELGPRGTTVNIVKMVTSSSSSSSSSSLAPIAWPLAFLLLPDAAFISGQELSVDMSSPSSSSLTWLENPRLLEGKVCLVTGASRGIGEAIATRLAGEGAHVLGVDLPGTETQLKALMKELGGVALAQDLTQEDSPQRLRDFVVGESGGKIDSLIHNAGLTRDKTLRRMTQEQFAQVVRVNLEAVLRINRAFGLPDIIDDDGSSNGKNTSTTSSSSSSSNEKEVLLRPGGRILLLASINGIAGAFGQTNYAFTKAALMGYAQSYAPLLAAQGPAGATINCIAPGFIETEMTAAIPAMGKFLGRRANAFSQGGLPEDIAAAAAFLCGEGSGGISGQTLRVCGLNAVGK